VTVSTLSPALFSDVPNLRMEDDVLVCDDGLSTETRNACVTIGIADQPDVTVFINDDGLWEWFSCGVGSLFDVQPTTPTELKGAVLGLFGSVEAI
jgi:hypothetical protein